MKKIAILIFLLNIFISSEAQFMIKGKVVNLSDQTTLPGASVVIKDTSGKFITGTKTNDKGFFIIKDIPIKQIILNVSYIGYKSYEKRLALNQTTTKIGHIELEEGSTTLSDVEIKGKAPATTEKGDTTIVNASAFKINSDASTQDLVQKMPGVTVQDGKVKAQGEDVKKVLVDGKEYFGEDVNAALQNLPADVVDKIQMYDQWSDQSQFTGFNDGNTSKTINIITKSPNRKIVFGKAYGGYGTDNRYQAAGIFNYFAGDRRITIAAQSNNINMQNFAVADLLGVSNMMRQGGGMRGMGSGGDRGTSRGGGLSNFMVNAVNGITQTNAGGINYSDKWGKKIKVNASYFINYGDNNNDQSLYRNYINQSDSGLNYSETSTTGSININHRFNMKFDYQIDSFNSITFRPKVTAQVNNGSTSLDGLTSEKNSQLSKTITGNSNGLLGLNIGGDLLYRHAFRKKGRTFSIGITPGYNQTTGKNNVLSKNYYYTGLIYCDSLNQQSSLDKIGWNASANASYTEPLSLKSILSFDYTYSYSQNNSDKETYDYNYYNQTYDNFNSTLSNVFLSNYITQTGGLGYMFRSDKANLTVNAKYQYSELYNNQDFPYEDNFAHYYNSILPSVIFKYTFNKQKNISINYFTSANSPSIDQLQNVINNSNPLQLTAGNPLLNQDYMHRMFIRYAASFPSKSQTLFFVISGNYSSNYIGNSVYIARKDTLIDNQIIMAKGSQLTRPENMKGYINARTFITYGFPIKPIKCNLNLSISGTYTRTPTSTNLQYYYTNSPSGSFGLVLSSNISEKIDFTISSNTSYNYNISSKDKTDMTQYLNQNTGLKFNWNFYKGLVYQTDVTHKYYSGLVDDLNNKDYVLWNMSLAYKFFKKYFEVKIGVYDLLNQNQNIQRTNSDLYTEDLQSLVLNRYYMLTASFTLGYSRKPANATPDKK